MHAHPKHQQLLILLSLVAGTGAGCDGAPVGEGEGDFRAAETPVFPDPDDPVPTFETDGLGGEDGSGGDLEVLDWPAGEDEEPLIPVFAKRYRLETKDAGNDPKNPGCQTSHLASTCADDTTTYFAESCSSDNEFVYEATGAGCHLAGLNHVAVKCDDVCAHGGQCVQTPANFCGSLESAFCDCNDPPFFELDPVPWSTVEPVPVEAPTIASRYSLDGPMPLIAYVSEVDATFYVAGGQYDVVKEEYGVYADEGDTWYLDSAVLSHTAYQVVDIGLLAMDDPIRVGDSGIVDKARCEEEQEGTCVDVENEDNEFQYSFEIPEDHCGCNQHPTARCRWVNTEIEAMKYDDPSCQGEGKKTKFVAEAGCLQI